MISKTIGLFMQCKVHCSTLPLDHVPSHKLTLSTMQGGNKTVGIHSNPMCLPPIFSGYLVASVPPSIFTTILTGILMVRVKCVAKMKKKNPPVPPDPNTSRCPSRSMAGKGGHLAQLQKVALVIEPPRPNAKQPASGVAVTNGPANLMAPTPHRRPRKNNSGGKQKVSSQHSCDMHTTLTINLGSRCEHNAGQSSIHKLPATS